MTWAIFPLVVMPTAVYVIWAVVLAIAVLVILPLTVYLLQRTLNAARNIERYMGEMRDAGVGIANNTRHITALDDTIGVATQILETAGNIHEHTAVIEKTLTARVHANGREQ
jgi:hypothetical protein